MTIKMNALAADDEQLVSAEIKACERVLRSGWWILGSEVAAFESEWCSWLQTPHAIGCANGLDAIEIGLRALGIGEGDEVVTTPMTAFATVLGIIRAGATPVFADIEPSTAMLSVESVRRCISPRTRAVLLVHLYGQMGPSEELHAFCEPLGIQLIEDCAQAHGARSARARAGSIGIFAAWSFYPTKNLGAIGDGGAITTRSDEVAHASRVIRNYGQTERYHHPVLGLNSRLDELQAALLRVRLQRLDKWVARRREIAGAYTRGISNEFVATLPLPSEPTRHVHHLFVILTAHRDALQTHLKARGVESLIHYPIPVHLQKPCAELSQDPAGLKHAERHAQTCLSLPCHPYLSDQDVDSVIAAVNDFRA
jgi:dTDP-4-amino-4,6-dideoxygalactose transaminase